MDIIDSLSLLEMVNKSISYDCDCSEFCDFLHHSAFFCLNFMLNMDKIVDRYKIAHKGIGTLRRLVIDSLALAVVEWCDEYRRLAPADAMKPDDWMYEQLTERFDEHIADVFTSIFSQKDCWLICETMDLLTSYAEEPEKPNLALV